jgi:hypothetical protein
MTISTSRIFSAVAGTAVAATIVGGVAIAQTTSATVITACVAETNGNVRLVGSAGDCKPNETTTTWNQQGPQGIPGVSGRDGVSGWIRVDGESTLVEAHRWTWANALCPEGKRVLGGGYFSHWEGTLAGPTHALTFLSSMPGISGTGWYVSVLNDTDVPIQFTPYAICATAL